MNWIGALLLVTASYFGGTLVAHREGDRLSALDSLISLLSYMHRRMSAERTPLYELFSDYGDAFLENAGFLPALRAHRNGLPAVWRDALKTLPLDREDRAELTRFGENLGMLTLEEQIKRLDACRELLGESRGKLRETLPAKQKSIRTVALMLGLTAAIILL